MKVDIKIIRIAVIAFIGIIILIYFINLLITINNNYNSIKTTEIKIEELNKNIRQEKRNQERIEKSGKISW